MKKSYRYRYRRVYPKQKWAINTVQLGFNTPAASSNTFAVQCNTVIENPSRNGNSGQSVSAASSILKCAHIKVKGVINSGMIAGQSVLIALMYFPEGISPAVSTATSMDFIGGSMFFSHPEWIMGWTRMDYSNVSQKNEFSITSRLKRNLNPGDTIRFVVYNINTNSSENTTLVYVTATSSYCCRAN